MSLALVFHSGRSLLAALAMKMSARRHAKDHVTDPNGDYPRGPGAGVVEQGQQQLIALAEPSGCRNGHDGENLLARQESQYRPVKALHRHRKRLLDQVSARDIAPSNELQERANRGQTGISTSHRVVPVPFKIQ